MLEVTNQQFEDLTEKEQKEASNNGNGKEYANYLRVTYGGKTILLESDAMEREDAIFFRDLSWIADIIKKAYEIGKLDAINKEGL
uniref:Uncharacterized protein n=1 Tax=viral metagenome TaxID=1070528 RepID=A0A6M3J9I6_9ZZZZ